MPELHTAHKNTCPVHHLPGRDWFYLLGPQNSPARNLVFGLATFPAGTVAAAHTHPAEEEMLYILSGSGEIVAADQACRLEPGAAVYIPAGTEHQIRVDAGEALELVTVFAPPVTPGAYDPRQAEPRR